MIDKIWCSCIHLVNWYLRREMETYEGEATMDEMEEKNSSSSSRFCILSSLVVMATPTHNREGERWYKLVNPFH